MPIVCLRVRSAALFVFLAGTAGAGIIASDLGPAAHNLLHLLVAGTGHAGLLQFAAFAALKRLFEVINRGGNTTRGTMPIAVSAAS